MGRSLLLKFVFLGLLLSSTMTAQAQSSSDPSIDGLVWNRWTNGNFTVLSINDGQGKYIAENIETMKTWILKRWGLPDIPLSSECKIVCVPDKALFNKLFNLKNPRVEVRYNSQGKIELTVMWLVLDKPPGVSVVPYLTEAVLSEFEQKYNLSFGMWFKKGSGALNVPSQYVKNTLKKLNSNHTSKELFSLDEESWDKLNSEEQEKYVAEFAALCLLLRKEFGQNNLHKFLKTTPEQGVLQVYKFPTLAHFDASFGRYVKDVVLEIQNSRMPDSYVNITPVQTRR